MQNVKPDITILAEKTEYAERVYKNSGTVAVRAGKFISNQGYSSGQYAPKLPWKMIEDQDAAGLFSDQFVAINRHIIPFDFDSGLVKIFHDLGLAKLPASPEEYQAALGAIRCEIYPSLYSYLIEALVEPFELDSLALNVTLPGMTSTTYDASQKRLRGLHIDNWCLPRTALAERNPSATRILLNFGVEARDFLFMNISVDTMLEALRDHPDFDSFIASRNLSPIVEAFMERFPDYPIFHMELFPGQGCMTPVCHMAHDGTTLFKFEIDFGLQISSQHFVLNKKLRQKWGSYSHD